MTCGHCSVESSPHVKGEPTVAELLEWVRASAAAGLEAIRITGGEPMLRPKVVMRLLRECKRLGVQTSITSNGFWGLRPAHALRQMRAFKRAGLGNLVLSYDRYHAEFMGPDPVRHINDAGDQVGIPVRVTLVRGTDEAELAELVSRFKDMPAARFRVYDLQPVGRARTLPLALHRAEVDGFCTACSFPAISDDGRLMACNGPAYFEPEGSPLVLGSLKDTSFAELLQRHRSDPILDVIRTSGPSGLRDELRRIPGFEGFPFRAGYSGICDLCHHITRDSEAVAALRTHLSQPAAVAERLARWQVIDGSRRRGVLSPSYVNSLGAARLFLSAAWEGQFGQEVEHILGRADFDWRRSIDYLSGSGLSRPLAPLLNDPALTRWAPLFYLDALRTRGVRESMRALVQQEAIEQIAASLRSLGARGVLLKGGALQMLALPGQQTRATSDVDLLVDPALAGSLRSRLLAAGFEDDAGANTGSRQHLAPVYFQGVPIEIHTRLMAPFWSLPEREMLSAVRPVPGSDVLDTLSPEGMLYHASTHASSSFFSVGLKTAWDIMAILRLAPNLDWKQVAAWAAQSRAPRAFWTPMRVLSENLGLPVPVTFLSHAPRDAGARRIALVAQHRLFSATETIFDLDVLTKAGVMLLLQDRVLGKARYLGSKVAWRGARPTTWGGSTERARRADLFRQAWRQYQRYRRAVARGVDAAGQ
jgi:hypothetical protein